MGLNWAAALDNFSKGMGQIAQVKYSEFMRQDEAKRREVEREIDFKRQQNLARFQVQAQKDMQAAGFTHAETLQGNMMDYNRERATVDDKFRAEQLDLSRQQVANQGAAAAASAAESSARLRLAEQQVKIALEDRELKDQLSVYEIPMNSANAQISALQKQRADAVKAGGGMADTSWFDTEIAKAQQSAASAQDGMLSVMIDSGRLKMDPEMKARFDETGVLQPGEHMPSILERLERARRPMAAPADPAQGEFIPTGGGAPGPTLGDQDPSERGIGGTVVPAAREQAPAPKFNVPPGLRVPGAEPPQDYTVSGITPTGDYAVGGLGENGKQVISKWDKFNLTNGASMAAGDAALAGGGSTRDIGASVSVAIRSLSPAAQQEVTRARSAADLSPTTIDELRTKNYNPDTLIGYLRRNG